MQRNVFEFYFFIFVFKYQDLIEFFSVFRRGSVKVHIKDE